jgi:P27 family predicted phage terminase small subunit
MPGPPPIPFALRKLRGNPGKRRLRAEPEPQISKAYPEPPSFLNAFALDEWWRTAPQLHALGLLSAIDVACLAAYCQAYGHWRQAEEALARMADRDETMHGLLIKTTDGNAKRNPLVKVAADAAQDMLAYAGHFGLTPVARTRLAAGGYAPSSPGKFDGLIGNGTVSPMRRETPPGHGPDAI